ncbi:MAG TPA: acyl-CoA desaturase, partial [Actinotalea sp.]|nr:acyl-CoA desaturase [Actinotalea sp.]
MAIAAPIPSPAPRERQVSYFLAVSERVQAAGLMRRRHGYYWTTFALLNAALVAAVVAVVALRQSWWQL